MRGLKNKVIIVAGVTSGMGEATAIRLAEEGAKVVVAGRTVEACERIAESIRQSGGIAEALYYDQSEEAKIVALVAATVEKFGRLDGLLCNAAELRKEVISNDGDLGNMSVELWERLLKVNTIGYALLMREAIPHMLKNGGGSIVLISSEAARMGMKNRHCYAVTKAGIESMVRSVAERWGQEGIRCNSIAPGMVMTEKAQRDIAKELLDQMKSRLRSPRLGLSTDIAAAAAFLLSDDGEWVQGQVISVNGGSFFRH
ncbi:MAG: SDR family oxidoreductase [Rhodocyclaceae bacterium]|jgi:NAD(P)-dependent dehydrogenase (short-subunit alcohol dehydrogenase family)|nr:SDR family oxidoreductase [Rhodocyclaceae bacterium]